MRDLFLDLYVKGRTKAIKAREAMQEKMQEVSDDQRGVSDMVVVLILIVIVVALAVIFRNRLIAILNDVFDGLEKFVNDTK